MLLLDVSAYYLREVLSSGDDSRAPRRFGGGGHSLSVPPSMSAIARFAALVQALVRAKCSRWLIGTSSPFLVFSSISESRQLADPVYEAGSLRDSDPQRVPVVEAPGIRELHPAFRRSPAAGSTDRKGPRAAWRRCDSFRACRRSRRNRRDPPGSSRGIRGRCSRDPSRAAGSFRARQSGRSGPRDPRCEWVEQDVLAGRAPRRSRMTELRSCDPPLRQEGIVVRVEWDHFRPGSARSSSPSRSPRPSPSSVRLWRIRRHPWVRGCALP